MFVVYRYYIILVYLILFSLFFGQYLVQYSAILSHLDYRSYSLMFFLCCCRWQMKIHSFIHNIACVFDSRNVTSIGQVEALTCTAGYTLR